MAQRRLAVPSATLSDGMTKPNYDLDSLGPILFVASLSLCPVAFFTLVAGIGAIGAGHGAATIWLIGLTLAGIAWTALLASCVAGLISFRRSERAMRSLWLPFALVAF